MKIVHVDTGWELRGGQRQLLLLARGLRERSHTQTIVCPEGSALEGRARTEEFMVFPLPDHDPGRAHGMFQLRQYIKTLGCDILHAHDGRGQSLAWLASIALPLRRVATRRVTFLPADQWTHRLKYKYTCDAVTAVSDFIRHLLLQSGVPDWKIAVIPDGIVLPAQLPTVKRRRQIRAQWGFHDGDFVIGHLGAFTPEKGQDLALDAFLLVQQRLPQARLWLVGDGPTRRSHMILERLQKAGEQARITDGIEDLDQFFPALDLFVMPSRAEGLGSAALHALAYGIPVVASTAGGLPEVVAENETGWLVPPESPAMLAAAVTAAADDPVRLDRFKSASRARAQQFSADIMLTHTEALYTRLLSG